jgi:L-ascorbate metabolism protein UlaG (beta-lactamase superfamily)
MSYRALGIAFLASSLLASASEDFSTSAGTVKITPIQHASMMIEASGKVLYADPAMGSYEGKPKADFILITDIHGDHLAPKVIDAIRQSSTVIMGPKAVADQQAGVEVISNGQQKTLGPFQVEAIPMYNLKRGPEPGKFYHDKGRGNGYVLTYGGKRFYISGDTEAIPEMKALKNIDVAFVCMNLPYTMTPEEAAEAVRAFHPAIVYPYHYRGSDIQAFAKALSGTGIDVRLRDWYVK